MKISFRVADNKVVTGTVLGISSVDRGGPAIFIIVNENVEYYFTKYITEVKEIE